MANAAQAGFQASTGITSFRDKLASLVADVVREVLSEHQAGEPGECSTTDPQPSGCCRESRPFAPPYPPEECAAAPAVLDSYADVDLEHFAAAANALEPGRVMVLSFEPDDAAGEDDPADRLASVALYNLMGVDCAEGDTSLASNASDDGCCGDPFNCHRAECPEA